MLINQIFQRDVGKYYVTKPIIISQQPSDVVLEQSSEYFLKIESDLPLQNPSHKEIQLDLYFSQSSENLEQIVSQVLFQVILFLKVIFFNGRNSLS